jgi:hypothetical protein
MSQAATASTSGERLLLEAALEVARSSRRIDLEGRGLF